MNIYFTVLKLVYVSFCMGLGALAAWYTCQDLVQSRYLSSQLVAVAACIAFVIGWSGGAVIFRKLAQVRIKSTLSLPPCKTGTCRNLQDFAWSPNTLYGWVEFGQYHYRCSCGDQYLLSGRRCMLLSVSRKRAPTDDGANSTIEEVDRLTYYKVLDGHSRWVDDQSSGDALTDYFFGWFRLTAGMIRGLQEWGSWVKVPVEANRIRAAVSSRGGEPFVDDILAILTNANKPPKAVLMSEIRLREYFFLPEFSVELSEDERDQETGKLIARICDDPADRFLIFPIFDEAKQVFAVTDSTSTKFYGAIRRSV